MAHVRVQIVVDPATGNFTYKSAGSALADINSPDTGSSIPMTRKPAATERNEIAWTCDHPFVVNFGGRSPFDQSNFRSPLVGPFETLIQKVRSAGGVGLLAKYGRFPYSVAVSVEDPDDPGERLVFIDGCPEVCVEC